MGGALRKVKRRFRRNRYVYDTYSDSDNLSSTGSIVIPAIYTPDTGRLDLPVSDSPPRTNTARGGEVRLVPNAPNSTDTARGGEARLVPNAPPSDTLMRQLEEAGARSSRPDPEEEMLHQLSCPICLDLYTDPILLPCLHSLCWECANSLWQMVNPFQCPECKRDIGRDNLKRNRPLNNLVSIYKRDLLLREQNKKENEKEKCSNNNTTCGSSTHKNTFLQPKTCVTCHKKPIVFCLSCTMSFCDSCLVEYHPTVESTDEHELLPVQNMVTSRSRMDTSIHRSLSQVGGTLSRVNAELLSTVVRTGRVQQ